MSAAYGVRSPGTGQPPILTAEARHLTLVEIRHVADLIPYRIWRSTRKAT